MTLACCNKLVSKVSAQKKGGGGGGGGGEVMIATNICSNFGGMWESHPIIIKSLPP